eukprot:COSAG01_NODE_6186_length_3804_cov_2.263428_6_plen_183_part_00
MKNGCNLTHPTHACWLRTPRLAHSTSRAPHHYPVHPTSPPSAHLATETPLHITQPLPLPAAASSSCMQPLQTRLMPHHLHHRRRPDRSCFRLANGGPIYLVVVRSRGCNLSVLLYTCTVVHRRSRATKHCAETKKPIYGKREKGKNERSPRPMTPPFFWGRNRRNGNQGPSRRGDTQEISGA